VDFETLFHQITDAFSQQSILVERLEADQPDFVSLHLEDSDATVFVGVQEACFKLPYQDADLLHLWGKTYRTDEFGEEVFGRVSYVVSAVGLTGDVLAEGNLSRKGLFRQRSEFRWRGGPLSTSLNEDNALQDTLMALGRKVNVSVNHDVVIIDFDLEYSESDESSDAAQFVADVVQFLPQANAIAKHVRDVIQ